MLTASKPSHHPFTRRSPRRENRVKRNFPGKPNRVSDFDSANRNCVKSSDFGNYDFALVKVVALWYFRARYYDAEMGRFANRAPPFDDGKPDPRRPYQRGYSLYLGHFVPNEVDPIGHPDPPAVPDEEPLFPGRGSVTGNQPDAETVEDGSPSTEVVDSTSKPASAAYDAARVATRAARFASGNNGYAGMAIRNAGTSETWNGNVSDAGRCYISETGTIISAPNEIAIGPPVNHGAAVSCLRINCDYPPGGSPIQIGDLVCVEYAKCTHSTYFGFFGKTYANIVRYDKCKCEYAY